MTKKLRGVGRWVKRLDVPALKDQGPTVAAITVASGCLSFLFGPIIVVIIHGIIKALIS